MARAWRMLRRRREAGSGAAKGSGASGAAASTGSGAPPPTADRRGASPSQFGVDLPYRSRVMLSLVRIVAIWSSDEYRADVVRGGPLESHDDASGVLFAIVNRGSMRPSDLARVLMKSPPAMSRLLDRMERAGFITRTTDPDDHRATLVDLAPDGRDAAQWLFAHGDAMSDALLDGFTDVERAAFADMMQRFADAVERYARRLREEAAAGDGGGG